MPNYGLAQVALINIVEPPTASAIHSELRPICTWRCIMTTSWIIRPSLLALVIIVALAAALAVFGTQSATADSGAVAPELEGTWLVTVTLQDGPPPFPSLVTMHVAALYSYRPPVGGRPRGTCIKEPGPDGTSRIRLHLSRVPI